VKHGVNLNSFWLKSYICRCHRKYSVDKAAMSWKAKTHIRSDIGLHSTLKTCVNDVGHYMLAETLAALQLKLPDPICSCVTIYSHYRHTTDDNMTISELLQ